MRGLAARKARVRGADLNASAVRAAASALRGQVRPGALAAGNCTDPRVLARLLRGADSVFHMAADPDVRNSTKHPLRHFDMNVMGTLAVLEAARKHDVAQVVFPSTSTVYGDAKVVPTPEDFHPLHPISVYGASKLACEGLLSSFCASYGIDAVALRFANVVGPGATHGVIVDLVDKLMRDPRRLEVLGDGRQRKSYVHIDDVVEGTLIAAARAPRGFAVYNVGSSDTLLVDRIAHEVIEAMGLAGVKIVHKPAPGGRGWVGDVKVMQLSIAKLRRLGFRPRFRSKAAVAATARAVAAERAGVKV
jgi:UDP-glucose 4-epimerase